MPTLTTNNLTNNKLKPLGKRTKSDYTVKRISGLKVYSIHAQLTNENELWTKIATRKTKDDIMKLLEANLPHGVRIDKIWQLSVVTDIDAIDLENSINGDDVW